MTWYGWLASYLPPILTILGYIIRLESRLSRIEGKLEVMLKNCEGGGYSGAKKEDASRDH